MLTEKTCWTVYYKKKKFETNILNFHDLIRLHIWSIIKFYLRFLSTVLGFSHQHYPCYFDSIVWVIGEKWICRLAISLNVIRCDILKWIVDFADRKMRIMKAIKSFKKRLICIVWCIEDMCINGFWFWFIHNRRYWVGPKITSCSQLHLIFFSFSFSFFSNNIIEKMAFQLSWWD